MRGSSQLDPAQAGYYAARGKDFDTRWASGDQGAGKPRPTPLKGAQVVIMHRDQVYLCHWLGLVEVASIEPKPGVPPTAAYLGSLVGKLTTTPPRLILLNAYNDPKAANWLSERVHAPAVVLPFSVGGSPEAQRSVRAVRRHHQQAGSGAEMNDMLIDFSILVPALVAGCLVAISHVPLGQQVLSRGIVFIDLAIAQVAALGVIIASSFELPIEGWGAQIAAGAAALSGALLLTWTERKRPEVQEALIGILFVLASTAQILLLANNPHGGDNLKDLLAGQILWVSNAQLIRTAVLTAVFAAGVVHIARAHRAHWVLRVVRRGRHGLRAARRCVPGVHHADRPGGRDLSA